MAATRATSAVRLAARYLDPVGTGAPAGSEPQEVWLQNWAIAIECILPALALVVCVLRGYSRITTKNVGMDDYLILAAMILSVAQGICTVIYVKASYTGIHIWEIPPHDLIAPGTWSFICGLIYNPILALVKISILAFLLRLASIKPAVQLTIWIIMGFTIAMMIAVFLAVLFVCDPIAFNWDSSIKDAHCFDKKVFTMATASLTILTDIIALAVPFWIFLGLRMARKAKIALLCVFALGFGVTVISAVRLYMLAKAMYIGKGPDPTFSITYVMSAVECNLAIIAASGPSLWPLVRRWFPRLFSGLGLSRGYQGALKPIEDFTKETQNSRSSKGSTKRSPRTGGWKAVVRLGSRGSDKNGSQGGNVLATHTIGGSSFALKDIRGDRARGQTMIRSTTPNESEEEIMTYNGIMRTTDYTVKHYDALERTQSRDEHFR